MAHNDSKRTDRARARSIERRQARACKHHTPAKLTRSGRHVTQHI